MPHPQGMRTRVLKLTYPGQLHIYSDAERLILQLRRSSPTEEDALTPSFKVAVELIVSEALAVASELLAWAAQQTAPGVEEYAELQSL